MSALQLSTTVPWVLLVPAIIQCTSVHAAHTHSTITFSLSQLSRWSCEQIKIFCIVGRLTSFRLSCQVLNVFAEPLKYFLKKKIRSPLQKTLLFMLSSMNSWMKTDMWSYYAALMVKKKSKTTWCVTKWDGSYELDDMCLWKAAILH